ncbi:hypothetical protein [Haliangium sp.]|uniref:golvesin C-terminal-like domain-containing protein n=1 Tax=Haliangium sp. TaxID=2663208 RepID=UPI003D0B1C47
MNRVIAIVSTCLISSQMFGCMVAEQDVGTSATSHEIVQVGDDNLLCSKLKAGRRQDAGDVCVQVVGDDLVVTYTTENGWVLSEAHLWVGDSVLAMPHNRRGAPNVADFPLASGDLSGATAHTVSVPLSEFGLSGNETACEPVTFFVAAHADMLRDRDGDGEYEISTSAWGAGKRFGRRGNRATYFSGKLECSGESGADPVEKNCETAFAFGGDDATCFLGIDDDGDGKGDFRRWGWTNGPLGSGTFVWDVYAGAGQCDLSKGTVVGALVVVSDGDLMTVSLELDAPYTMEDAQLYVGNELLPRDCRGDFTVAPGQYPQVVEFDGDSTNYTFAPVPVSGQVHVVAHATVCGFGDDPPSDPPSDPPGDAPTGEPEVVLDNHDHHQEIPSTVSFTGFWDKASGATGHFGLTGLFAVTGGELDTYRFTPELTGSGNYRVMVWNNCYSPRANNVPHTIVYDGGSVTIEVDQDCATGSHSEWLELGVFPFVAGTSGYLEVSDAGLPEGQYIGVDAVRFLREDVILLDEGDPGTSFTGEWSEASAATEHHGVTSLFAHGSVLSTYRFTPTVVGAGNYEVLVWNSCYTPREGFVPHTVAFAGGSATIGVDQDCASGSHGEFLSLGVFPFDAGSSGYIEISNEGTSEFGYVGADAVLLVPAP